ncbi:hypothetical protein PDTK01_07850 [Phycicoccus sp. DTK01]|nr:hypothetical protein PDTK01_07850 [Phycicoccus sp. DTK01]
MGTAGGLPITAHVRAFRGPDGVRTATTRHVRGWGPERARTAISPHVRAVRGPDGVRTATTPHVRDQQGATGRRDPNGVGEADAGRQRDCCLIRLVSSVTWL